jgi:hypothetical protein
MCRLQEAFVDRAHKLGYHFDATSAGTLQKVFDGISDADKDVALCLELLKRKAMQRSVIIRKYNARRLS